MITPFMHVTSFIISEFKELKKLEAIEVTKNITTDKTNIRLPHHSSHRKILPNELPKELLTVIFMTTINSSIFLQTISLLSKPIFLSYVFIP